MLQNGLENFQKEHICKLFKWPIFKQILNRKLRFFYREISFAVGRHRSLLSVNHLYEHKGPFKLLYMQHFLLLCFQAWPMQKFFTKLSTVTECSVLRAVHPHSTRSCWRLGTRTPWRDRRSRPCSGSSKISLHFLIQSIGMLLHINDTCP